MTDTFSYSMDQERYTGEFASRDAAEVEALSESGPGKQFWTGRNIPAVMHYPDATWAIEYMQEQAWEDAGEISETFLDDVSKEQTKELNDALAATIDAWMARHGLAPSYFTVEDVQTHASPMLADIAP